MASSLELIALKLLGPGAAVVVGAAALAGGEAFGLDIGAAELGGGALALFLLREVFGFVRWNMERRDPRSTSAGEQVELLRELVDCQEQQTEILKRMQRDQAVILEITKDYEKNGRCPFTIARERQEIIEGIGEAARQG